MRTTRCFVRTVTRGITAIAAALLLAACGSSGGTTASSTPTTPTTGSSTATLSTTTAATAAVSTLSSGGNADLTLTFPANTVSAAGATATVAPVAESALPTAIASKAATKSLVLTSGNTYVLAFTITVTASGTTISTFNTPVTVSGTVKSTFTSGTTLNLAQYDSSQKGWVDVATVIVGANGAITQTMATTALPGILAPGTYVLYKPASGTSTAVSNLGIALIANDGYSCPSTSGITSGGCLQVVNIYDANGVPLATPTVKYLAYANAGDLDGQALTPDGSQGIMVDGGNTVRFFSNVQTGIPVASTTTLDVSKYGGDGDSVAIMPTGDEAVVSADSSTQLLVVSGITAGKPVAADVITVPDYRDGLVISNDGKVLLASGYSGLTVYSIAAITPKTGSLGGAIAHSFTQLANLTTVPIPTNEDGRNGMASSPKDSSRAVVVGHPASSYSTATIALLTGLTTTPTVGAPVTIAGAGSAYSVAITPDGKYAVVGTDKGIVLFSGVDTGTLQQVGTAPYAPTFTGPSGGPLTMGGINTLGITLDGKYVVVGDGSNHALLTIPIDATAASGFKAPVGVLNGVAIPYNDQMVIH